MPKDKPENEQDQPKEKAPAQPQPDEALKTLGVVLPPKEKMGPACQFLQEMLKRGSIQLIDGGGDGEISFSTIVFGRLSVDKNVSVRDLSVGQTAFLVNLNTLLMAALACQEERRAEKQGYGLPGSSVFFAEKLEKVKKPQPSQSSSSCSIL